MRCRVYLKTQDGKRYAYGWVTLGFFLISLAGHWLFGWLAYVDDQSERGQSAEVSGYFVEMSRDTFENWQSEFLQLLWQIAGLALVLYVGSPQSRESSERSEAKLDAVLRKVDPDEGERVVAILDQEYDR